MAHTLAMAHFPPADASVVSTDLVVLVNGTPEPTVSTKPGDTSFAIERQLNPGDALTVTITDFNQADIQSAPSTYSGVVPDLTPPPSRGPITVTFGLSG